MQFNQQPKMKMSYADENFTVTFTWNKNLQKETTVNQQPVLPFPVKLPCPETTVPPMGQLNPAINSFYSSTPFQRLIAMQHILNQTRLDVF